MDRGEFFRLITLSGVGSIGGCGMLEFKPPNILLILTDDQMFYSAGLKPSEAGVSYWMPKLNTSMRQAGMEFTRAYITTPICTPSRASIMTGRFVHNHEVYTNDRGAERFRKLGLGRDHLGLHLASEAGYYTGYMGKVLNHYQNIPGWIMPGYKDWVGILGKRDPIVANVRGRLREPRDSQGNKVRLPREPEWIADRVIAFMSEAPEPWFCVASIQGPHSPHTPSPEHKGTYSTTPMPLRPNFDHFDPGKPAVYRRGQPLTNAEKASLESIWRGKMEELLDVDDAVERILAHPKADVSNTYAFFASDNGFLLGEHRLAEKAMPYEEASRTPLLMRGPGITPASTSPALAANIDIATTAYEIAGVLETHEASTDGRSLLGLAAGAESPEWRDALLLEQPRDKSGKVAYPGWAAIRRSLEDSLYVEHPSGERELYDMAQDPYQLTNLAHEAEEAELVEMSQHLDTMREAEGEALRAAEEGIVWTP